MISAAAQAQVLESSDMEEETWMRARGKTVLSSRAGFCIRTVILLLLLMMLPCLFSLLIISQTNPSTAAASDLAEEFQSALDAFQKQYGFPGATAAYVLQDGTAGVAATGAADIEAGTPMTVQSRMLSASLGKTFVGATAVALAREGILDLDIPVSRWLGDRQWFTRLPNHNAITFGKKHLDKRSNFGTL